MNLFPIIHCKGSNSIIIITKSEKRIVYSGDGIPNYKYGNFMDSADFLIHECTYTNEYLKLAKNNNHSSFEEVVSLAMSYNVKCLILSHFSINSTELTLSSFIDKNKFNF